MLLLLAGCGGRQDGANFTVAANESDTAAAAPASDGFDATNACATLPAERIAALTGLKVSSATLGRVTQPTPDTAGFSTCAYAFAGGGTLDLFTRQAPFDDNTPEAIARTRNSLTGTAGAKLTDVPGLGDAAFATDQLNQLHVFFGGRRYVYFISTTPPPGKDALAIEKTLAAAVVR